jgi:hypothetical protein
MFSPGRFTLTGLPDPRSPRQCASDKKQGRVMIGASNSNSARRCYDLRSATFLR